MEGCEIVPEQDSSCHTKLQRYLTINHNWTCRVILQNIDSSVFYSIITAIIFLFTLSKVFLKSTNVTIRRLLSTAPSMSFLRIFICSQQPLDCQNSPWLTISISSRVSRIQMWSILLHNLPPTDIRLYYGGIFLGVRKTSFLVHYLDISFPYMHFKLADGTKFGMEGSSTIFQSFCSDQHS